MKKFSVIVIFILTFVFAFIMVSSLTFAATKDSVSKSRVDLDTSNVAPPIPHDADQDGYISTKYGGDDCNDHNAAIHPGAQEICEDGIDQDCSGADLECPESGSPVINSLSDYSLDNGQAVIINGSGFGAHSNSPLYWDNFDDGQAQGLDLTTNPGMYDPDVNDTEKHSGAYSLRSRLGDPDVDVEYSALRNGYAIYWFPQVMQGGDKLFFSFWQRWDWGVWYCADGGGATTSYQIKNFRIGSGNHAVTPPDIPQNNQSDCVDYPGDVNEFLPRSYMTNMDHDSDWYSRDFLPEFAHPQRKWMLFEVQVKQSHDGQYDGSYEVWLTREGQTRKIVDWQNTITHRPGDPGFNKVVLNTWIDSFGRSTTLYVDDLFVGSSFRRVAIGNNPDYYESTKREIQPYSAWSDNSITISANLTAFSPDDSLYLFVFDENGSPSEGQSVSMN